MLRILREAIKGIEDELTMSRIVSLVEQPKEKDEKNQKEAVPSVDLSGGNTETQQKSD